MAERAQILHGPWKASPRCGDSVPDRPQQDPAGANRVVLGWVVRECAVALGHDPSPRELADWANHQQDDRGEFCLFGRAISDSEAAVILKHPGREVTVRASRALPRPGLGLVAMPSRGGD